MTTPRWQTYALFAEEELRRHWEARLAAGARVAFVLGIGFDPRMNLGLELLSSIAVGRSVALFTVRFDAPADSVARLMADENHSRFEELGRGRTVTSLDVSGRDIEHTARSAADAVRDLAAFGEATDIVVDINALPRSVFFPLVAKLLYLCDQRGASAPNLHVLAGDAAWLDAAIRGDGIDEHASWLYPFRGTFGVEATDHMPRVWLPILGEETTIQLERIYELINPSEVCPLLPFPARNPRRADALFNEYHRTLFEQLRTDSGTVIYADEANPFQVYRRLRESTLHYAGTLEPLGGCKTAYSALSSKLVAVGALLVAYELRDQLEVGVADIGSQTAVVSRHVSRDEAAGGTKLIGLTLSGDSYL
jgi:hypothetical protein